MANEDDAFVIATPCSKHGFQTWGGHACCEKCGKIYANATTDWSVPVSMVPPVVLPACSCGHTVFHRICPKCFKYLSKHGGRVAVENRKSN